MRGCIYVNPFISTTRSNQWKEEQKDNEERTYNKRKQRKEMCLRVYIDRRVKEKMKKP